MLLTLLELNSNIPYPSVSPNRELTGHNGDTHGTVAIVKENLFILRLLFHSDGDHERLRVSESRVILLGSRAVGFKEFETQSWVSLYSE